MSRSYPYPLVAAAVAAVLHGAGSHAVDCHGESAMEALCPIAEGPLADEHQREPPQAVVEAPVAAAVPTSDMPPGKQVFVPQRDDQYRAHWAAQVSAMNTTMRRNAALYAAADREFPPTLLTGPIGPPR